MELILVKETLNYYDEKSLPLELNKMITRYSKGQGFKCLFTDVSDPAPWTSVLISQPPGIGPDKFLSAIVQNDVFLQRCSQKYLPCAPSLFECSYNPKISIRTRH